MAEKKEDLKEQLYNFELNSKKSNFFTLKNGKRFKLNNKKMLLTKTEVIENFAGIKNDYIIFIGEGDSPINDKEIIKLAEGKAKENLEEIVNIKKSEEQLKEVEKKYTKIIQENNDTIIKLKREKEEIEKKYSDLKVEYSMLEKKIKNGE